MFISGSQCGGHKNLCLSRAFKRAGTGVYLCGDFSELWTQKVGFGFGSFYFYLSIF